LGLVGTYRQPEPTGDDTSARAGEYPTRRLFIVFLIRASEDVYNAILDSPKIRELTPEEVATTEGCAKGGLTKAGETIANNIFSFPK
jgi:hypothetical protein